MSATVVIADDDADIRELVAISVARAGLTLLASVADGAAALSAMPELTGIEVCRAVRADPDTGDLRILLLSASVEDAVASVGLDAGADHFMPKPFSPRALTEWLAVGKEQR